MLVDLDDRAHLSGLGGTLHDIVIPGGGTFAGWGGCMGNQGLEPGDRFTLRASAGRRQQPSPKGATHNVTRRRGTRRAGNR